MGILKKLFGKKEPRALLQDIAISKDWIASALNSSNYNADFSLNSLKEIDRFFVEQNTPKGLLGKNVGSKIFAIGSYVGEVIITVLGGEWVTDDDDPKGEINISIMLADGSLIFPVQRVMNHYKNGRENGIYDYVYALLQNEKPALGP